MAIAPKAILALDVGTKRVGVAIAMLDVRFAYPLPTLDATDPELMTNLQTLIQSEAVGQLVVGMPRGLQSQETDQTTYTRQFIASLRSLIDIPIDEQDEALTSAKAEDELRTRGKPYKPEEVDALAATYILEDWLREHEPRKQTT